MAKKKLWVEKFGDYGNTVTVRERYPDGPIYVQVWDRTLRDGKGGYRRESLGNALGLDRPCTDKAAARAYARRVSRQIEDGVERAIAIEGPASVEQVVDLYLEHRTPDKSERVQRADERKAEHVKRYFGPKRAAATITATDWNAWLDALREGAVDPHGNPVPVGDRQERSWRTVQVYAIWFKAVFAWAADFRVDGGTAIPAYLCRPSPVAGYRTPKDRSGRRPEAITEERHRAYLEAIERVAVNYRGRRWARARGLDPDKPYMEDRPAVVIRRLLVVLNGTGRRLSACCQLRVRDLSLGRTEHAPHGAIRWPEDSDKAGEEWLTPMEPEVRAVVDEILAERQALDPAAPLFRSPRFPSRPISRQFADAKLREAEGIAKLEPLEGTLCHAYRRKFITERMHLPWGYLMQLAGIKDERTLVRYMRGHMAGQYDVLMQPRRLREVSDG